MTSARDEQKGHQRSEVWQAAFDLIRTRGHERRDEPFKLASGQLSHDYIDGKYAVDTGERLAIVSRAVAELAAANGIEFDAVGGLTMGADPLSHGVAMVTGKAWFSVRKEQKQRGREQWVEGTRLEPGTRVLLVDDVISTGGSTALAFDRIAPLGVVVTGVIPMVDRGDVAAKLFAERDVPFVALVTYRDLGIEPIKPVLTVRLSTPITTTRVVTVHVTTALRRSRPRSGRLTGGFDHQHTGRLDADGHPIAGSEPARRRAGHLRTDDRAVGQGASTPARSGPRNATEVTAAVPAGSAVTVTDSGRTIARPAPESTEPGSAGTTSPSSWACPAETSAGTLLFEPDELRDERRRGVGVELGGGGQLLELALTHHADPVGDGERLLLVVRDESVVVPTSS